MMTDDEKEKAARALERKILRAIERGEFTPNHGYLKDYTMVLRKKPGASCAESVVEQIGPCGCAIAAAASVNGFKIAAEHWVPQDRILAYLKKVGIRRSDSLQLEIGYESGYEDGYGRADNPYFQVGERLRRFHPKMDGRAE